MKPSSPPPDNEEFDWDPRAPNVLADQRAAYDEVRTRCPVARTGHGQWTVFRHADVSKVIGDHGQFSNVVSQHPSVPNGMDPPRHTIYRRLIEPYFSDDRIQQFEPRCRQIASRLIDVACDAGDLDLMPELAYPFAASAQCDYLGWEPSLAAHLIDWTHRNHRAVLDGDRTAMADIAARLDRLVAGQLEARRPQRPGRPADLTAALIREHVDGRPLVDADITSILRNWTMGEVATIAAAVGILAHFVAQNTTTQHQLRRRRVLLPDAIEEILRLNGPLVSNRRRATSRTVLGDRVIEAGDILSLNWIAANRDPDAFADPGAFRLDRTLNDNLLYGAGIHVCPGAGLARMELRVVMEELLAATRSVEPIAGRIADLAAPPAAGFSALPLRLIPI